MKIAKEVKIGFIFAAGLVILVWGINFFKDRHLFSNSRIIYAVYSHIDGLTAANAIVIHGMKIGQVDDVYFTHDTSQQIVVRMIIDNKQVVIPKNSIARIITSDIMGARSIEIILGNDYNHVINNKDTMLADVQTSLMDVFSKELSPIKTKAEGLIVSIDSVLAVVKAIFNKKTQENLSASLESINNTLNSLEHTMAQVDNWVANDGKLNKIFGNIESITTNIKTNNDNITKVIQNFSNISDSLAKANFAATITSANKTLADVNTIISNINKGKGSVGMLLNNDSLYNGLSNTATDLDLLMKDLKENPHRYLHFSIFGGKKK